jgi:hypothetical protein
MAFPQYHADTEMVMGGQSLMEHLVRLWVEERHTLLEERRTVHMLKWRRQWWWDVLFEPVGKPQGGLQVMS